MHPNVLERFDVGLASEEPQKLVDDALEEHFFRGDEGKALSQGKAQLPTKQAVGSYARAIFPIDPVFAQLAQ